MTLSLERARSRRPVTWLTLIGVVLLPVVIGGILVAALYNPVERLGDMRAAIVNNDKPVTVNGQLVPLGRQLSAGLVEGSDDLPSNLTWTISNTDDAAAGLADGTYDAVITIPENFSAAATSTAGASDGSGGTPEKATISAQTSPDSLIVDDAITSQVASAAASVLGTQLSTVYLENVFLGFTTLGDKLGEAATGAHQLADGASQAATGAAQLPAGATALATGATQLGDGATELSAGLTQLADGTRQSQNGAGQLAAGLGTVSGQLTSTAADTLGGAAATTVSYANAAATATQGLAGTYTQLLTANNCIPPATPTTTEQGAVCLALGQLATGVKDSATAAGYTAGYASGVQQGLGQAAAGIDQLTAGASALQTGLGTIADGQDTASTGATGLASGASQLATGATQLAAGATTLADGVSQLSTGTASLADGLDQASTSLPSYTDQQASDLASVVANPVQAEGTSSTLFGASAIPLLAMLALWFGGLASFIALQAVPRHALSSRRSSALLAVRALAPAAAIGALQGLLVAVIVQLAAGYDAGAWWSFAGLAVVAGIAFAAVNQALVAVFGGAGRWISALVGVLAVATGIVSTVPGVLSSIAGLMPTTPAYNAMLAALTAAGGLGAGLAGMIVWAGLALVATIVAVARRRTAKASALLAPAPALA
ncbi:YhgE/Pip family protein [uncultured Microbacterium sp.]|uniref:YhgE/Pip family protein n=1 Tax=uncultured Microbacterium sp. TaxID=191216 RepID=UPI0028EFE885|nr:YhgE/Pip family protein [uncultured Microbacterium sp.]